jgi:putative PIN family toxin of toxin-antitoxin system
VIVSAAMSADGIPFAAFAKARSTQQIAMSQPVFDELSEVLHRRQLERFVDPVLRADLMDELLSATTWFTPLVSVADCRDPRDHKYLELALAASASVIVSSDQDLLVLHPWRGTRILRPADYLMQG